MLAKPRDDTTVIFPEWGTDDIGQGSLPLRDHRKSRE
ncbi:hypothetical protein SB748_24765 [Rhizobium sp. SIMBA_035]